MKRRIRVHIAAESTFVIESTDGVVTYCSRGYGVRVRTEADPSGLVGLPELDAARKLRAEGALFVDLDSRTLVRPGRGYAARGDRGRPLTRERAAEPMQRYNQHQPADKPRPAKRAPKDKARPVVVNSVIQSLRNYQRPVVDVQLPDVDAPPF